jgi:DNA mismatch repair ATPase MutS
MAAQFTAMILFNESFVQPTSEGSEIATQILSALLDRSVRMICVTHLYELSRGFYQKKRKDVFFLRAERNTDGARTFKLTQAEPLQTSFGEDLYQRIFVAEVPLKSQAQERAEIRL